MPKVNGAENWCLRGVNWVSNVSPKACNVAPNLLVALLKPSFRSIDGRKFTFTPLLAQVPV